MTEASSHLEEDDDEEPDEVEHEEDEGGVVAQCLQVCDDLRHVLLVVVDRVQILVDELLPEARLVRVEVAHGPPAELRVRQPVRVDQVVALDPGRVTLKDGWVGVVMLAWVMVVMLVVVAVVVAAAVKAVVIVV